MPPLVILTGPTAVGKSRLSLALAKALGAEIVSADSMQVYRGMDIGTDKLLPEERQGVPHHLIDILAPTEPFHAVRFQKEALYAMEGIYRRGRIPLLVGGTGFYIQSVLYRISFTQKEPDEALRRMLLETAAQGEQGVKSLHARLSEIDPLSAERIPVNNVRRVIRALEYHALTGETLSAHNARERSRPAAYDFRYFVLTDARPKLYERIDARVDAMMEAGLLDEVKRLMKSGVTEDMTAMQGLGYRELAGYLGGQYDLERAVFLIKRNTRHFAKRQLTWFRREKDVIWLDKRDYAHSDERILEAMRAHCAGLLHFEKGEEHDG